MKQPKRDTIQKIGQLRASRFTIREIAAMVGLSKSRVHQICREFKLDKCPLFPVAGGEVSS